MPVKIIREIGFVDFLRSKLNETYPRVENSIFWTELAASQGDAFRVEVNKPEGRMVKFFPANGQGAPFLVGELSDKPNCGTLNLTAYQEIPEFIQSLIDEYMAKYPTYDLSVLLAEKKK